LRFSRKLQYDSAPNLFSGFGENTCSLQPALKSNAPGLKSKTTEGRQIRKGVGAIVHYVNFTFSNLLR